MVVIKSIGIGIISIVYHSRRIHLVQSRNIKSRNHSEFP